MSAAAPDSFNFLIRIRPISPGRIVATSYSSSHCSLLFTIALLHTPRDSHLAGAPLYCLPCTPRERLTDPGPRQQGRLSRPFVVPVISRGTVTTIVAMTRCSWVHNKQHHDKT